MTDKKRYNAKDAASNFKSPCCNVKLYHYDRNLAYCDTCGKDFFWDEEKQKWTPVLKG